MDFKHLKTLQEVEQSTSRQTTNPAPTTAKMPKLVITKFAGTPQDWVRFWGQFDSQINKSAVDEVTKFSYLKELVEIKVRELIDGLPFTSEGYLKAIDILKKRYGQPSEVVYAYVRAILELPTIKERDVAKIHQFYETLLFNVESLQTLESLDKLDAAVRFTFDKLVVIKNEPAMTNEKWDEWTFVEFVKALERWPKTTLTVRHLVPNIRRRKAEHSSRRIMGTITIKVVCSVQTKDIKLSVVIKLQILENGRRSLQRSNCALTVLVASTGPLTVKAKIDVKRAKANIILPSAINVNHPRHPENLV